MGRGMACTGSADPVEWPFVLLGRIVGGRPRLSLRHERQQAAISGRLSPCWIDRLRSLARELSPHTREAGRLYRPAD